MRKTCEIRTIGVQVKYPKRGANSWGARVSNKGTQYQMYGPKVIRTVTQSPSPMRLLNSKRVLAIVLSFAASMVIFLPSVSAAESTASAKNTTQPASAPAAQVPKSSAAEIVRAELINLAGESDDATRKQAAIRILKTSSPEGVQALVTILKKQNNESAKLAICKALASPEVSSRSSDFVSPLLYFLNNSNPALQEAAAEALGVYSDPQVVEKLKAFRQNQYTQRLIDSHRQYLKLLHERTAPADQPSLLTSWLKSVLFDERMIALDLVQEAMNKGTAPANGVLVQMRTMLDDAEETVRIRLVEILGDLRHAEDAPLLRAMLDQRQSPQVREAIFKALGLIEDINSIPYCIKGLVDPEPRVAAEAATALGSLYKPELPLELRNSVIDALLKRAENNIENDILRAGLIGAMSRMKNSRFLPVLRKHGGSTEKVPAIRQTAIRGIGLIGDPAEVPLAIQRLAQDPDVAVRETAAETIGRLGNSVDHLKTLKSRLDGKKPAGW